MADHLDIQVEQVGSAHLLKLSGELDLGSVHVLRHRLDDVTQDGKPNVVVDLRELAFLDSSGLRELIAASRRAASSTRGFGLIAGRNEIQRVFEISGTADRFTWIDPWDV